MSTEISIIVPVYNLESFLPRCVDSILSQTFTDFELILVNDGSTDGSGDICDEYAKNDNRVKVIHKENGGVASSRNAGLEIASGNYIGFVDNDDYVNKFMFEILYGNAVRHSSDIVVCDYRRVDESESYNIEQFKLDYKIQHFSNIESLNYLYIKKDDPTFIYPWNKLYKRHLFNHIKYEVGNIYDDETVAHQLFYESKKVTYIHAELYYYTYRAGSSVNRQFNLKAFGRVYALKDREVYFRNKNESNLRQKALIHYMETFFWNYYKAKSKLTNIDKELKELKRTFDKTLIYLLIHKQISWKQKLMCILFSINPILLELIQRSKTTNEEKLQTKI